MNRLSLLVENIRNMESRTRLQWGMAIAALLVLALLYSAGSTRVAKLQKKRSAREADVAEIMVLKQRLVEARAGSQMLANRMAALRPEDSPARIVEETGIKGKTSQSKQLKTEERGNLLEDVAEVKLEGLSANEAINLLFRLEKGDKPVLIKKARLNTRFDDPGKLDMALTISLLRPSPQGQK